VTEPKNEGRWVGLVVRAPSPECTDRADSKQPWRRRPHVGGRALVEELDQSVWRGKRYAGNLLARHIDSRSRLWGFCSCSCAHVAFKAAGGASPLLAVRFWDNRRCLITAFLIIMSLFPESNGGSGSAGSGGDGDGGRQQEPQELEGRDEPVKANPLTTTTPDVVARDVAGTTDAAAVAVPLPVFAALPGRASNTAAGQPPHLLSGAAPIRSSSELNKGSGLPPPQPAARVVVANYAAEGAPRDDLSEYSWEYTIESGSQFGGGLSSRNRRSSRGTTRLPTRGSPGRSSSSNVGALRRRSSTKKRLSELTADKLNFKRLGRLYGRDDECERLRSAWEDVRPTTSPVQYLVTEQKQSDSESPQTLPGDKDPNKLPPVRRLVTVSGASGTGKSSLVQDVKRFVQKDGGLFLNGSFPQQHQLSRQAVEPYAAFESACNELCEIVLSLYDAASAAPSSSQRADETIGILSGFGDTGVMSFNSRTFLKFSLQQFRDKLDSELGADALILTSVIPGLLQILKTTTANVEDVSNEGMHGSHDGILLSKETIGYLEAHHQFKFAFRRFMRVVTSFAPVLLVLDDIQWADTASMELLEALISDRECSNLMVIACYRDDEVYEEMPHFKSLENVAAIAAQDSCLELESIKIGTLSTNSINELLVDLLSSTPHETKELAECVHKKTMGNVFFVVQFLTLLQEMGLLAYSFESAGWTWDLPAIQSSTAATDNVVNLMKNKMRSLPKSIGWVLPIMACLGSSFTTTVLELVVEQFGREREQARSEETSIDTQDGSVVSLDSDQNAPIVEESLALRLVMQCEDVGLLQHSGGAGGADSYHWVHDKIQEAAFSLISEMELQSLKLKLGGILFEGFEPEELEKQLFTVVNLLSADVVYDGSSVPRRAPLEVAKLYLRAGVKAIETSAFEQASGYLKRGIDLLPPDHWQKHYDLSLELFSTAAEAEYCTGSFETMRQFCDDVIRQRDRPLIDTRRAYNLLLASTAAEKGFPDALVFVQVILGKLGVRFPRQCQFLHVALGIFRAKAALKKYTPEKIAQLPPMKDELKLWTMTLLDNACTHAYLCKSPLLPMSIFKALRLTLDGGVSAYSPPALAFVGLLLSGYVGDYKGGVGFGDQALALLSKSSRGVEARTIQITYGLIMHWLRPLHQSLKPTLEGYEAGMMTGHTEAAGWSIFFFLEHSFRIGRPLDVMAADLSFYTEQLREVKQLHIRLINLFLWQAILHLTGENPFMGTLTGDILEQEQDLADMDVEWIFASAHRMQMYVAFVFDNHRAVYDSMKKTNFMKGFYEKIFPGIIGICHLYAFNGLSMMALYRETKERTYLRIAKKCSAKIKNWALAGVSVESRLCD
jgi:predicted ATPase